MLPTYRKQISHTESKIHIQKFMIAPTWTVFAGLITNVLYIMQMHVHIYLHG